MAEFAVAVQVVLEHEGKKGTLPGDPGGLTNFGWSSAECKRLGIPLPRTEEEAVALYAKYFWNPLYNQIVSQNVASKLLDNSVNQGTPTGVKHLQQALNACGHSVLIDSVFGSLTLAAINETLESDLLAHMRKLQYVSYQIWLASNPSAANLRKGLAARAAWPDPDGIITTALLTGNYKL
jgi:lysozyme family protein